MAKYRADITEERYYPDLVLLVKPNDVVDLPAGVDAVGLTPIDVKESKSTKVDPVVMAEEEGA